MVDLKHGAAPIDAEIVRGHDGHLYLRSGNKMAIGVIANELGACVWSAGDHENAICLSELSSAE